MTFEYGTNLNSDVNSNYLSPISLSISLVLNKFTSVGFVH